MFVNTWSTSVTRRVLELGRIAEFTETVMLMRMLFGRHKEWYHCEGQC